MEKPGFEDGLLLCLDILQRARSVDEAEKKIIHLLDAYKESHHSGRVEMIKDQLGIWDIL